MNGLRKIWVRILISLLVPAFYMEAHHISTGNELKINLFFPAILIFLIITFIVLLTDYVIFRKSTKQNSENDVLDSNG